MNVSWQTFGRILAKAEKIKRALDEFRMRIEEIERKQSTES